MNTYSKFVVLDRICCVFSVLGAVGKKLSMLNYSILVNRRPREHLKGGNGVSLLKHTPKVAVFDSETRNNDAYMRLIKYTPSKNTFQFSVREDVLIEQQSISIHRSWKSPKRKIIKAFYSFK